MREPGWAGIMLPIPGRAEGPPAALPSADGLLRYWRMSLSFVNETPVPSTLAGPVAPAAPRVESPKVRSGRQRRAEPVTDRVRRDGKFFRLGSEKFYVKGVTYGPFAPNSE